MAAELLWFDDEVTVNWSKLHAALRHDPVLRTQYWEPMLDRVKPGIVVPTSFEEWNADYPAGQREINRQARETARRTGIVGVERKVKAFIKVERLPLLIEKVAEKSLKPRLIQGRHPEVTASSGPTFHALGKLLRNVWDIEGHTKVVYATGTTAEKIGRWYEDCVKQGLCPWPTDAAVWDASVGPGPHLSERADLLALGVNQATRKVLEQRETGRDGSTPHGIKYRLWWQVCSGDGDTSFGNTLAMGKVWLWCTQHIPCRVAVNGDNALPMLPLGIDPELVDRLLLTFRAYGFTIATETLNHTHFDGEMCSGRLWAVGTSYVYGPKIGRVLAKTFWAIDPPRTEKKRRAWLRGVGMGLRRNTAFVPVLRVIISRILDETKDVGAVPVDRDEPWKIHAEEDHEATSETIEQFCYLYSCTRLDLVALEDWLRQLPTMFRARLDHPLLNRVIETDLA